MTRNPEQTYQVIGAMSGNSSIPCTIHWRALKDSGHSKGKSSGSDHCGSNENKVFEMCLVPKRRWVSDILR
jgi:hypothetical protein